jgi:hypothetical protein
MLSKGRHKKQKSIKALSLITNGEEYLSQRLSFSHLVPSNNSDFEHKGILKDSFII